LVVKRGDIYRIRKKSERWRERICGGYAVFGKLKFPTVVDGEV